MPRELTPDALISVSGSITDRASGHPIQASIFYSSKPSAASGTSTTTNTSGYLFYVTPGDTITTTIYAENYYVYYARIGPLKNDAVFNFELIPKQEGTIIEMRNILFIANSATLLDSSYHELVKIYQFLNENPGISIEIRGHTNGLCDDAFCKTLSQKRAKAVADYLISLGIAPGRITHNGYGKSMPVAPDDTPAGRLKNQRVEFMITRAE
jgi:outer membrane protein OmpA-like peptidoglycan-associated protein